MIHPTIHRNGTHPVTLREDWSRVIVAAIALRSALANAAPNGRDYYVQDATALVRAEDEHLARVWAVDRIISDMEELIERTL